VQGSSDYTSPSRSGHGEQAPVRLNLGSAHDHAPGWISYDRSRMPLLSRSRLVRAGFTLAARLGMPAADRVLRWPASVRVRDLTRGIPHATGSVDAIYSSHMLEHLEPDDALFVLRDCYRALRPGGTLRIVVPDLNFIVRAYLEGKREFLPSSAQANADAFLESLDFRPAPRGGIATRALRRALRSDDGGHKWMYDEDSLILRLREIGFRDVRRVPFGEGRDTEAARLDSRSPFHVHVEAVS
jgi:SAM-dependent methyltransferase